MSTTETTQSAPRRPGRSLLWLVLGVVMVMVASSPWILRAIRIASVPNIPLPFDEAAVGTVTVKAEDNALEVYKQASTFLKRDVSQEFSDQYEAAMTAPSWEQVPTLYREWLERNQPAFDLFLEGAKHPEYLHIQPRDYRWDSQLDITHNLREFANLARFRAMRRQSLGDVAGAWEVHRATLQASRHVCLHGGIIERLLGTALHAQAADAISLWAQDPRIDAALLRKVRDEVADIYRQTPPASGTLQVEYFALKDVIDHPEDYADDSPPLAKRSRKKVGVSWSYFLGEPECTQRILRLVFANWMQQMDLPLRQRAQRIGRFELYDRPIKAQGHGVLSPQQIESAGSTSLLAQLILPFELRYIDAIDREVARQRLLELTLAIQLFAREHDGKLPEKLELLVPKYLDQLPIDLWGPAVPMKYRADSKSLKAAVWSVGPDGVDDAAVREWPGPPSVRPSEEGGDLALPMPRAK